MDPTSRALHNRVGEHESRSQRTGALLSNLPSSNVRLHVARGHVSVSEPDFKLLSSCERSHEALLNLEPMFIRCTKPNINDLASAHILFLC